MNSISTHIARHLREFYSGKNWTASGLSKALEGVTWQDATTKVGSFNTIATLVYHIHYYVEAAIDVLEGRPLDRSDELSFNHPPIASHAD